MLRCVFTSRTYVKAHIVLLECFCSNNKRKKSAQMTLCIKDTLGLDIKNTKNALTMAQSDIAFNSFNKPNDPDKI